MIHLGSFCHRYVDTSDWERSLRLPQLVTEMAEYSKDGFKWYESSCVSVAIILLWTIYGVVWRLYLSPLAKFPGPKLAALTSWYEIYYDVLKGSGGLYIWKIEELHKRYGRPSVILIVALHFRKDELLCIRKLKEPYSGPIIRINPHELHISDPEFYDQIYAGASSPRAKYEWHQKAAQAHGAIGHTVDHKLHRLRKDALSPFFSKPSVKKRESKIQAKVDQLCSRIQSFEGTSQPVNLTAAYLAMSMDVITEYAFGETYGLLSEDDFNIGWRDTILSIVKSVTTLSHFAWLPALLGALPTWIAQSLMPDVSQLLDYESVSNVIILFAAVTNSILLDQALNIIQRVRARVQKVLNSGDIGSKNSTDGSNSIFEELRDSEKLPSEEKSLQRLTDEGNVLLIAASETPAKVLALITYHLLANPNDLERLRMEIASLEPKPEANEQRPNLAQLESLPFLKAVVREGLRLHNGIVARSQRISPNEPLQYQDWTIPPGTPISCISTFMHYNPDVFPEPRSFRPRRWLDESSGKHLENFLVAFGRGTRSCLGYNLGLAELYLTLAAIMCQFDMQLFETEFSDVNLECDWFVPQPKPDTKGVRVLVEPLQ